MYSIRKYQTVAGSPMTQRMLTESNIFQDTSLLAFCFNKTFELGCKMRN